MKAVIKKIGLFSLVGLMFVACSTEDKEIEARDAKTQSRQLTLQEMDAIAVSLQSDKNYIKFVEAKLQNSLKISQNLITIKDGNLTQEQKSLLEKQNLDYVADVATYCELFYLQNTLVKDLDEKQMKYIAEKTITDAIKRLDQSFQKSGEVPAASLDRVLTEYQIGRNDFNTRNPGYSTLDLEWGEIGACVIGAVGGYIADNWTLIKGLAGALKGESISYGVVKAAVLLFFPQAKMAATVIGLVGCLLGSWLT